MTTSTLWSLDVVAAAWADKDVTSIIREKYAAYARENPNNNNTWKYTPTSADPALGDPAVGYPKFLILTWRVLLSGPTYVGESKLNVTVFSDGQESVINYDGSNQPPFPIIERNFTISSVYYYDKDFKDDPAIEHLEPNADGEYIVDSSKLKDPKYGTPKCLVVTYGYKLDNGKWQWGLAMGRDINGKSVVSFYATPPPRLFIRAATYGGIDVTPNVAALVSPMTQSISVPDYYALSPPLPDNWLGTPKSLLILYQWETCDLELYLGNDVDARSISIDPRAPLDPTRAAFFNKKGPNAGRVAGELNIIATVWGIMKGMTEGFGERVIATIKQTSSFTPSNQFFNNTDGWYGYNKTATIFFQYGVTGSIQCVTAKQGTDPVKLPVRSTMFSDPLPGRGFLAFNRDSYLGFTLRLANQQNYVAFTAGDSFTLTTTPDAAAAALFNIEYISKADISVLSLQDPKQMGVFWYASYTAATRHLTFSQRVGDSTEFHWELPGISALIGTIVLNFNLGQSQIDPVVVAFPPGALGKTYPVVIDVGTRPFVSQAGTPVRVDISNTLFHPALVPNPNLPLQGVGSSSLLSKSLPMIRHLDVLLTK
jgi:hypothetical protein